MQTYTKEQEEDIKERVEKANKMLKEFQLVPATQTVSVNLGAIDPKFQSVFGTLLQTYLQDTKFSKTEDAKFDVID